MLAPTVPPQHNLHVPAAAHQLALGLAEMLVQVEAVCHRERCGPDCEVARAARRVAINAAALARELTAERAREVGA